MILRFVGYLMIASLLLKIPVCVAAIWKTKELPLLLLISAAMFSGGVLVCYVIAYNGFVEWIMEYVISGVIHIATNAAVFAVLLRQLSAKHRQKREKRECIGE